MNRVLQILNNTDRRALAYIWRAALLSIVGALVIAVIAVVIYVALYGQPEPKACFERGIVIAVASMVLTAPWIETLLMWPILALLKLISKRPALVASCSASIWALAHWAFGNSAVFGMGVWWPFFVFSTSFLAWEKKSRWKAIAVTATIHMCQNTIACLALLSIFLPEKIAADRRWDAFHQQLENMESHVVSKDSGSFGVRFTEPVLTVQDLKKYFRKIIPGVTPKGPLEEGSCSIRYQKAQTESRDFDIIFRWSFVDGKLSEIGVSSNIAVFLPSAHFLWWSVSPEKGGKQLEQTARRQLDSGSGTEKPTLQEIVAHLGEPTRTNIVGNVMKRIWRYTVLPDSGFLPHDGQPRYARVAVDVPRDREVVTRIEMNFPPLNLERHYPEAIERPME